jgi:hypothetical protein
VADRLITTDELGLYLQQTVDAATAGLLVETATGVVQRAVRQRLIEVTDQAELLGEPSTWLQLPERPATAVPAVTVDGSPITDYVRYGSRLWRACGWRNRPVVLSPGTTVLPPYSTVLVTYTHGWPEGAPELESARSYVLGLCAGAASNPTNIEALAIDDYRESRGTLADRLGMALTKDQRRELRREYGRRVGSVRP